MKNKKLIIIIVTVALLVIGIFMPKGEEIVFTESNKRIKVQIEGEVLYPGTYEVEEKSRIEDVIRLAGGITVNADISKINLAQMLDDGYKVLVPNQSIKDKININYCTTDDLKILKTYGLTDTDIKNIINYRTQNNYYTYKEELIDKAIIKENVYIKIKEFIII